MKEKKFTIKIIIFFLIFLYGCTSINRQKNMQDQYRVENAKYQALIEEIRRAHPDWIDLLNPIINDRSAPKITVFMEPDGVVNNEHYFWGNTNIKISITDDVKVNSHPAKIFISGDDQGAMRSPNNCTFTNDGKTAVCDFTWRTTEHDEGPAAIVIYGYDSAGNKETSVIYRNVKNLGPSVDSIARDQTNWEDEFPCGWSPIGVVYTVTGSTEVSDSAGIADVVMEFTYDNEFHDVSTTWNPQGIKTFSGSSTAPERYMVFPPLYLSITERVRVTATDVFGKQTIAALHHRVGCRGVAAPIPPTCGVCTNANHVER